MWSQVLCRVLTVVAINKLRGGEVPSTNLKYWYFCFTHLGTPGWARQFQNTPKKPSHVGTLNSSTCWFFWISQWHLVLLTMVAPSGLKSTVSWRVNTRWLCLCWPYNHQLNTVAMVPPKQLFKAARGSQCDNPNFSNICWSLNICTAPSPNPGLTEGTSFKTGLVFWKGRNKLIRKLRWHLYLNSCNCIQSMLLANSVNKHCQPFGDWKIFLAWSSTFLLKSTI